MNEEKGKAGKGFYIEEEILKQIDNLLEQVDVKSRNEFLNQALKFHIEYLTSEKLKTTCCPRLLLSCMQP